MAGLSAGKSLDAAWVSTGNPATVDDSTTSAFAPGQLGKIVVTKDASLGPQVWQYVLRSTLDGQTMVTGAVTFWEDIDDFKVNMDASDCLGAGTTGGQIVAGFHQGTKPTAGNYGFILVSGAGQVFVKNSPTDAVVVGGRLHHVIDADGETGLDYDAVWADATAGRAAGLRICAIALEATTGNAAIDAIVLPHARIGW